MKDRLFYFSDKTSFYWNFGQNWPFVQKCRFSNDICI